MKAALPFWVDALTSLLVVLGGIATLLGSFGLLRLGTFFQRAHAPTLGSTLGTWCFVLATVVQLSFVHQQAFLHALLIPLFLALTAPITTIFLMRAAVFRERVEGSRDVPSASWNEDGRELPKV